MSQPADRHEALDDVAHGTSNSRPPQVTFEPLTSFKRSLEEVVGFDLPSDEPLHALAVSTAGELRPRTGHEQASGRHFISSSEVIVIPDTTSSSTSQSYPTNSMPSGASALATRRSSQATPPLLPPIDSQSHLLELISDFSAPSQRVDASLRLHSPTQETTGSSSTSETEIFLSSSRRPETLRMHLNGLRQRLAATSSSSPSSWASSTTNPSSNPVTRRLIRNASSQQPQPTDVRRSQSANARTVSNGATAGPSRLSLDRPTSHRSPELPPIDTSDHGLGGLSSLLYGGEPPANVRTSSVSNAERDGNSTSAALQHLVARSGGFIPSRPFVESPSPPTATTPISQPLTMTSLTIEWDRIREFQEAIAPLRATPSPGPGPGPSNRPHRLRGPFPPVLPHPFEEVTSPSTPGTAEEGLGGYFWERQRANYRDELRYIHNLTTVLDEREADLTPVRSIPMLPPIVQSPLLVVDDGLNIGNETPTTADARGDDDESEWEIGEAPAERVREARRNLGRASNGDLAAPREARAPILELPNFSTTSLSLDYQDMSPSSPSRPNPLSLRVSTEQMRQMPTEHLRQLRRAAVQSFRSRSRSSFTPSVLSNDSGDLHPNDVRPESVVSNEDIIVGVPPMLDEPFDRSVWRALENRIQTETNTHNHHHHRAHAAHDHAHDNSRLGVSTSSHLTAGVLGPRGEPINDVSSNVSVRSAVSSPALDFDATRDRPLDAEFHGLIQQLNEMAETSLTVQSLPTTFNVPSTTVSGGTARSVARNSMNRRLPHARPAAAGDGSSLRLDHALRQEYANVLEGVSPDTTRLNSLAMAWVESETPRRTPHPQSFSPTRSWRTHRAGHTPVSEFQLLDEYWTNSNPVVMQDISRELEFMERYLLDNRPENPRSQSRSFSPNWDADDPLSGFLSDVGFDGSYEALMELSEQLGVVPRGVSDSVFATLETSLFRDIEPQLMALASPALSSTSMSKHQRHLSDLTDPNSLEATISNALVSSSSPASPTRTSFTTTTRMHRVESGKWVAQCSICLDSFAQDAVCVTLICSHFFHQSCLREWFRSSCTCPLCRCDYRGND